MSSTPHFAVSQQTLKEIAQSLLECKKMGRSIENAADAFLPMAEGERITILLDEMAGAARLAAKSASELYKLIARDAANA